jgi:hypothetical protein
MQNIQYIKVPFPEALNTFGLSDAFLFSFNISGNYGAIPFANDGFDLYATGGGLLTKLFFSGSGFWLSSGNTFNSNFLFSDNFDYYATGGYSLGFSGVSGQNQSGYLLLASLTGLTFNQNYLLSETFDNYLTGFNLTGCIQFDSGILQSGYFVSNQSSGRALSETVILYDQINNYQTGYDKVGYFTGVNIFSGCLLTGSSQQATKGGEAYFHFESTGAIIKRVTINANELTNRIEFDTRINKIPSGSVDFSGGSIFATAYSYGIFGQLVESNNVIKFSGYNYNSGVLFSERTSTPSNTGSFFITGNILIETGVWKRITGYWNGYDRSVGATHYLDFSPIINTGEGTGILSQSGKSIVDIKNITIYQNSNVGEWQGSMQGTLTDLFTTGYVTTTTTPVLLL